MDPNGKLLSEIRSSEERNGESRAEHGRASEQIGLGRSEQSKENRSIEERVDQREARRLDRIEFRSDQSEQIRVDRIRAN